MTTLARIGLAGVLAIGAGALACASGARADGHQPFYGYSGYFGGPAVYYTPTPDVHQSTSMRDGEQGFGIRTYTNGGPFWGYKPHHPYAPYRRGREVIRTRG